MKKSSHGVSRVEEERRRRPSSLIPPDVRISRIRRTKGISSVGTHRLNGHLEAFLIPDDDKDARRGCDHRADDSRVDFGGVGECSDDEASDSSLPRTPVGDGRSQSIGSNPPTDD